MTQRPKKLLDQVRACPELGDGMQFGSRTVAGQRKHYTYSTAQAHLY